MTIGSVSDILFLLVLRIAVYLITIFFLNILKWCFSNAMVVEFCLITFCGIGYQRLPRDRGTSSLEFCDHQFEM